MKFLFFTMVLLSSSFAMAQKADVLLSREDVIWGFDFLPDKRIIFTERSGKILTFDPKNKKTEEIQNVPKVYAVGQGGMLDIRVHPKNGYIYFTYSEPDGDLSATALARAKLVGNKFENFQKIFTAGKSDNDYHYGSRIEFAPEGKLFITSGERGERKLVQKQDNYFGKIIRMNEDGSSPEVWSYGIRSPQGLAMRPGTNDLWEAEMGPRGGDEVNLIKKGANYGWPEVTYGREYVGLPIGVKERKDVVEPVVYWLPSISPSAMTFWKGDIYLANLSGEHIRRLQLDGNKVVKQEELLKKLEWRFRNVRPGPDNELYFSTDEGRIGKLVP